MEEPAMTIEYEGLTDAEVAALAKAGGKPALTPGDHAVDFVCRVTGLLRQGEPTDYTPTVSIPHKRALAFLVQFAGLGGEAALAALAHAMRQALDAETPVDLAVVERAEQVVAEAVGSLPRQRRAGRLSVVGDLTIRRLRR
jgi:hypothetical protein